MTGRDEHLQTIFGKEILKTLHESKVLVVGAGGIGCELLKDLVMTGFHNIEVLDLDTIDLSNLNRQFLFQNEHIKQSKAIVARETVLKFNPKAIIVAHFDNIFNKKYNIEWFKQFKIVLNALDNVAARRHVNKMCLAAGIPLVESGTAGYLGQVSVHLKNLTKCYDCDPKEIEQKTYPVCTIRSTPSTPIHCIVWAKNYLFNALFGKLDEQEEDLDSKKTKENEKEIENMKKESQSLLKMRDSLGSADSYQKVFERVFVEDIKTLITMKDLWTTRKEPNLIQLQSKKLKINHTSLEFDQQVWTLEENIQVFKQSLNEIAQDLIKQRKKDPQVVFEFDKDDERFLNFVTSTANIRAIIFHIQPTSRFITKEMAGNIIPAIATTNAIVAGMVCMNAVKILSKKLNECKNTFVAYGGVRTHLLMNEELQKPSEKCPVCTNGYFMVRLNNQNTLKTLIDSLKDIKLEGEVTVQVGEQYFILTRLMYDVEFEDNLEMEMKELGIEQGTQITVTNDDDDQDKCYSVMLFVSVWKKDRVEYEGDRKLKPRPRFEEHKEEVEEGLDSKGFKKIKGGVIEIDGDEIVPISLD